jgi:hypothetical protein
VTLSLPSVVGRDGVISVLQPDLSAEERRGLERSAESLRKALGEDRRIINANSNACLAIDFRSEFLLAHPAQN